MAVLIVMLFHFDATRGLLPGGSLGVDLFFVLSGFLITTLLLEERFRAGAVSLTGFYQRRARRLLPALALFLVALAVVTLATSQPGRERLPATLITTVFYIFNWLDDIGGSGLPGAGHLWSLSVEEQFYLLWPVVLILALRSRPETLFAISVAVFVLSASLPFWSGRDYGHLYSGTEFRAQQLMAGALLAQVRFAGFVTPATVKRPAFRAAAFASVLFFAFALVSLNNRVEFLLQGWYTVTGIAAVFIVCGALYAPPPLLTNRIVCYVGRRSYALYLWHHVIDFWLRDLPDVPALLISFVVSFAAAEISWRLVEDRQSYAFRLARWLRARRARGVAGRRAVAARPADYSL